MKQKLLDAVQEQTEYYLKKVCEDVNNLTFTAISDCKIQVSLCGNPVFIIDLRKFSGCDIYKKSDCWTHYLKKLVCKYHQSDDCKCKCDKGSYYEDKKCKQIYFYDFTQGYNPADFTVSFGDDGVVTQDNTGVTVTSNPFTATVPVGNEHVKWLKYNNVLAHVPDCGEIIYEAEIAVEQYIPLENVPTKMVPRIRNVNEDIRLASAGINVIDTSTWCVADILLSNEMIYGFYERLPFGKPFWNGNNPTPLGDYAAYSNCFPIARRAANPLNDFVRLGIGYTSTGHVKWYVDGVEKFSWERVGTRLPDEYRMLAHGGADEVVQPKSFNFGFGTFSLLDMALPYNYARQFVTGDQEAESQLVELEADGGYVELYEGFAGVDRPLINKTVTFAYVANEFPNNNHDIKLFGQGAAIRIKYQKLLICQNI